MMTVTPRQLAAAGALLVVVLASMATRSAASGTLPGPPAIEAPSAPAPSAQVAKPKIYTPAGPRKVDGCVIGVSNANPEIGAGAETVTVRTTAGAWVSLSAGYASYTSTYGAQADQGGMAVFELANPNATPGRTVSLAARVSLQGSRANCDGSFTPKPLVCAVTAVSQTMRVGEVLENVVVSSAPGAQVRLSRLSGSVVWNYARRASTGVLSVPVPIPWSEVGKSVRVQVEVAMLGAQAGCVTSFVPTADG